MIRFKKRQKLYIIIVLSTLAVFSGYFIEKHSNTGFVVETATETEMEEYNDPGIKIIDGRLNINYADLNELDSLKGIGEKTAQAIIDYRTANGPFSSVDDLKNVKGIGDKTLESIRDKICVE